MIFFELFDELSEYSDYKSIKKNDWKQSAELNRWLDSNGFEEIGSGMYSNVYQKPGASFVVKVYQNSGASPERELAWYEYCHSNKRNPFLPKVGKIKQFGDWYVVFIERLQPLSNTDLKKAYNMAILPYLGMELSPDAVMEKIEDEEEQSDFRLSDNDAHMLVGLYEEIEKVFGHFGWNLDSADIHDENIMARGHQLVISDPIEF